MKIRKRDSSRLNKGALAVVLSLALNQSFAGQLEEVLVTASKRSTVAQDTPISITAFSSEELDKSNLTDLRQVHIQTPGLFISSNDGFGGSPITIRGIGSLALGIGAEDGVGIYIDGVFQGRPFGHVFEFIDVERVEVLRGPQGTLYGRNATGGAINVVTLEPSSERIVKGDVTFTEYSGISVRGLVSGALSDTIAGKFSFATSDRDGYATNPTRGEDVYDKNNEYFSGALSWAPNDNFKAVVRAYTGTTEAINGFKDLNDGLDIDVIPAEFTNNDEREFSGVNATLTYEVDNYIFKSITAYVDLEHQSTTDSDGGPLNFVEFRQRQTADQFSQEFQITSIGDGDFNWIVGALYFHEEAEQSVPFDIPLFGLGIFFDSELETDAYSLFADVTYGFSDKLSFTAGARWSTEDKNWKDCQVFYTSFATDFSPSLCNGNVAEDDDSWNVVTPHFVLDYKVSDDMLLYASITRGFRSGGWNLTESLVGAQAAGDPDPGFDQEFVWSYEAGMKGDFLENRLRANLAIFFADYTDLQVRVDDPVTRLVNVANAGEASIFGIEGEFKFLPTDNFYLTANFAYLDASYDTFIINNPDGTVTDSSGKFLNRAPEWSGSVTAAYDFHIADLGTITPRLEYSYKGETFHSEANVLPRGSESFGIVNARVRFEAENGKWGVQVFIDNLTDERYYEYSFEPIIPSLAPTVISAPSVYGLQLFINL